MTFLVLGSGSREHAIIKRLTREGQKVISYGARRNIGIQKSCPQVVATEYGCGDILRLAHELSVDLILPSDEFAIFAGVGSAARQSQFDCLSPTIAQSRLEQDKGFAKALAANSKLVRTAPHVIVSRSCEAESFAQAHNWSVVAKGLAGGKDVVKLVDSDPGACEAAITQLTRHHGSVMVEAFISGRDFSVYCISDGVHKIFFKTLRDYPFRYEDNIGPKTGSMGAVSASGLLPGISQRDYDLACVCIEDILDQTEWLTTERYVGFLVGQFIKSEGDLFFVECDVKPGDPETVNILESMDVNFGDVLEAACHAQLTALPINNNSVVSICHAPRNYPEYSEARSIDIADCELESPFLYIGDLSYSGGKYWAGLHRTLTVVGGGGSIKEARISALARSQSWGQWLTHRRDIGIDYE